MQPVTGRGFGAQACGFAATEYEETIFMCARLLDAEGKPHYSDVIAFSPETYAALILNANHNAPLVKAMQQMVLYGEEARVYLSGK